AQIALRQVREASVRKGLRLSLDSSGACVAVPSDSHKIRRIMNALLSNAVKFTPEGGQVGLELDLDDVSGRLRVEVWDTGIGVAKSKLQQVFEPFVQGRSGRGRQHGGAGLGLALSSRLTSLIGADLSVHSVEGEGSRFTLSIPVKGPERLILFGDLNCPFSHTLNEWIEELNLGHLIAWHGVEQMPALTRQIADSNDTQALLTDEWSRVLKRCEGVTVVRPCRRTNTHIALCVLNYLREQGPQRINDARRRLFRAIWRDGLDISTLDTVSAVLDDFDLGDFELDGAASETLQHSTAAWRALDESRIPTVVSEHGDRQHLGLGQRSLLHQFILEELGLYGDKTRF
ncbi:MAG: ATP-binding protein, partial [Myxococcota bacterium]|nr:ATP-binding protein [Myxococcota bacterium]